MKFAEATSGALRFGEIDAAGNIITNLANCKIGQLYFRKSFIGDTPPAGLLTVSVRYPANHARRITSKEFLVLMRHAKKTPKAHRFCEIDEHGIIIPKLTDCYVGQLYMRKSDIGDEPPEGDIEVVVTFP